MAIWEPKCRLCLICYFDLVKYKAHELDELYKEKDYEEVRGNHVVDSEQIDELEQLLLQRHSLRTFFVIVEATAA